MQNAPGTPPAGAVGSALGEEHGDVGADLAGPVQQLRVACRSVRELVCRPQGCRGVAAAAAKPRACERCCSAASGNAAALGAWAMDGQRYDISAGKGGNASLPETLDCLSTWTAHRGAPPSVGPHQRRCCCLSFSGTGPEPASLSTGRSQNESDMAFVVDWSHSRSPCRICIRAPFQGPSP